MGSASNIIDDVGSAAKDTAAFFAGGTSGMNVAQGEAPTTQTVAQDAAGLAGGAGIAGSGVVAGSPTAFAPPDVIAANQAAEDATFGGAMTTAAPGAVAGGAAGAEAATGSPAPTGSPAAPAAAGAPTILTSATPTLTLDPTTAAALGVDQFTGFTTGATTASAGGDAIGSTGMGTLSGGFDPGISSGTANLDFVGDLPVDAGAGAGDATFGGAKSMGTSVLNWIEKNPAQAALLGLTGYNMTRTPKIPDAAKTLEGQAGPGSAAARGVISSGGTNTPAWATQKSTIDASVDQQIQDQVRQIAQNATNTGQGTFDIDNWAKGGAPKPGDSMAAIQQANSVKNRLEAQRQQLYLQAQQQNVSDALSQLGIDDQALGGVANAQFAASKDAQQTAAQTASLVLMLTAMGNKSG